MDHGEGISRPFRKHLPIVQKGEPVIVTGVLAAESWVDQNGKQQSKLVMEANAAGHDLSYGVSTFRKLAKKNDSGQQDAQPDRL